MHVRLDVLRTLASDLAQAIYLFIPSRAVHHAKEDPWKINLANLFDQLGMNVPVSKSLRKKALCFLQSPGLRSPHGVSDVEKKAITMNRA
jgi:hypothetical protein